MEDVKPGHSEIKEFHFHVYWFQNSQHQGMILHTNFSTNLLTQKFHSNAYQIILFCLVNLSIFLRTSGNSRISGSQFTWILEIKVLYKDVRRKRRTITYLLPFCGVFRFQAQGAPLVL